ncbi:hypothetical protein KHA80_00140 [Anaerobacillus sp. HL2]|nr:hypothetical protein KHA80_00140 [Anaerobacillus sp. HL2]
MNEKQKKRTIDDIFGRECTALQQDGIFATCFILVKQIQENSSCTRANEKSRNRTFTLRRYDYCLR